MNKLRNLLIKFLGLDTVLREAKEAKELLTYFKNLTTIDVDLPARSGQPSMVIVSGRFKDRDYINVFEVNHSNFESIVHYLDSMKKYGIVRYLDAPIAFSHVIKRER